MIVNCCLRNKLITLSTYHLNSKLPIIFSQLHCSHNFYNNNNNENRTALEQQLLHFALLGVAAPLLYHFLHIVHIHQTEHFVCTLFSTIIMSIFYDLFIFICAYAVLQNQAKKARRRTSRMRRNHNKMADSHCVCMQTVWQR